MYWDSGDWWVFMLFGFGLYWDFIIWKFFCFMYFYGLGFFDSYFVLYWIGVRSGFLECFELGRDMWSVCEGFFCVVRISVGLELWNCGGGVEF